MEQVQETREMPVEDALVIRDEYLRNVAAKNRRAERRERRLADKRGR